MYGIKMKLEYILEILYKRKNNDARLQDTSIRGRIALIDTDTYELLGYVDLVSTEKKTYEDYVNWHINLNYDAGKAREYINNLEFTKLKQDAYFYNFENKEILDIPVIINPKSETNIWVEFDLDDSQRGYKQMSLFDL